VIISMNKQILLINTIKWNNTININKKNSATIQSGIISMNKQLEYEQSNGIIQTDTDN